MATMNFDESDSSEEDEDISTVVTGTRVPPCLKEPSGPSISSTAPIEKDPVITSTPLPLLNKSAALVTAEGTVEASPWDTSAWETIIVECRALDVRHARKYYEAFLDPLVLL